MMNHVRDSIPMNAYGRMKEVMVEDDEPHSCMIHVSGGDSMMGIPPKKGCTNCGMRFHETLEI